MQNLGLQPSSHTYDGIIRAVVSQRSFGDAMGVVSSITIILSLGFALFYFILFYSLSGLPSVGVPSRNFNHSILGQNVK